MSTYYFSLPNVTCGGCTTRIEGYLKEFSELKIKGYSADPLQRKLTIDLDDADTHSPEAVERLICSLLNSHGYDCEDMKFEPGVPASSPVVLANDQSQEPQGMSIEHPMESSGFKKTFLSVKKFVKSYSHWFLGTIGTVGGIALLILSLTVGAIPLAGLIAIAAISVPLILMLGATSYIEAAKKLFKKSPSLTMDTLFVVSTLTIIVVSIAAFFVPWLPMMFEAGLLIFGFHHLGQGIKESIKQATNVYKTFSDSLPSTVHIVTDELSTLKPLDAVQAGDLLEIYPGEIIPVNGYCEADEACIEDSLISGNNIPYTIERGTELFSGMTVAKEGPILRMRATTSAKQSYLPHVDKAIERALLDKEEAPLVTKAQKIMQYFIPAVIILAILCAIGVGYFFTVALAIQCAISVLVSACPCTLGLITPLAVTFGLRKAAANQVQFKSAKTLEEAGEIDCVVFDLNGTLTEAPSVQACVMVPAEDAFMAEHELLAHFYALEKKTNSTHPFAKAICEYIESCDVPMIDLEKVNLGNSISHSGLSAMIDEKNYALGNQSMMDKMGINTAHLQSTLNLQAGETPIYLACEGRILGYLILVAQLRADALETVNLLKAKGMKVCICTGADMATAQRAAVSLGIAAEDVRADLKGEAIIPTDRDKKSFIKELKKNNYRVAFIGDGPNDAAVVSNCDFSLAVKSEGGHAITQAQAGATIQNGSLLPVVTAFTVAKQTVGNIKQNLLFSLGYNIASMVLASGLLLTIGLALNPAIGVALMVLQACLMLLNTYRVSQQKLEHLQNRPSEKEPKSTTYGRLTKQFNLDLVTENHLIASNDEDEKVVRLPKASVRETPEAKYPDGIEAGDNSSLFRR